MSRPRPAYVSPAKLANTLEAIRQRFDCATLPARPADVWEAIGRLDGDLEALVKALRLASQGHAAELAFQVRLAGRTD
jgi:hypothetical protein